MKNYNNNDTFLARWLNDDLTPEELTNFENSKDYQSFEKIARLSSKFKIPTFDDIKVKNQINTSINKAVSKSKNKAKVRLLYYTTAIAASIALCMAVGINFWNTTTTIASNFGETKNVFLPDGSIASLNGNSEITYLKKEWKNNNRKLFLKGEVFFIVKKGSKFTVETQQGEVHVVGTEFNVKTLNNFYAVECYEGIVLVKKHNAKDVLLTSGGGLRYTNGKKESLTFTNTNPNWKNRNYVYKDVPLSVIFNDLQNVYNTRKLYLENIDLNLEFTGKLVVDDLNKALNIICKSMNLEYALSKNDITITSK